MKSQAFAALFIASLFTVPAAQAAAVASPAVVQTVLAESGADRRIADEGGYMVIDRVAEGGAERTNRIAEGGADRTNTVAEGGAERTNRVAEGGADRTNTVAEGGAERTNRVAEGGADRLQAQTLA